MVVQDFLAAGDAGERCKMTKSATLGVSRVRVLSTPTTIQVHHQYIKHQSIDNLHCGSIV